ncbi:MAG: FG-GAP-like repeat-containing protein, partial [Kofleriaceae bacterium]
MLVAVVAVACNDAVSLVVDSDRPVPEAIDSLCVGVADVDASGGTFGRVYPVASLPQSLRLEPGNAEAAWAWVRGDRGGVPVIRAGHRVDFTEDVTLGLARCPRGSSAAPALVGDPVGPPTPRLVVSNGANGQVVVAIGATVSVIDAVDGALVSTDAPAPPPGTVVAAIAADVDGDCDDDLVIATSGGPPVIWLRTATSFTVATTLGDAAVAALGAADVDGDGDLDLIQVNDGLNDWGQVYLNDGQANFTPGSVLPATVFGLIATGDLDGDADIDVILDGYVFRNDGIGNFTAAAGGPL